MPTVQIIPPQPDDPKLRYDYGTAHKAPKLALADQPQADDDERGNVRVAGDWMSVEPERCR